MTRAQVRTIEQPCPHCGQPYTVVNGLWLRERRLRAGITQRQLGAIIGASGPHISDWERNRRTVPPEVVEVYRQLRKASA